MLHAVQFTRSESHLYSHTHLQKLEISSMWRVKCSLYTRQSLAVYTSIASKNGGVQRVKTPVKTTLLVKFNLTRSYCNWQLRINSRLANWR